MTLILALFAGHFVVAVLDFPVVFVALMLWLDVMVCVELGSKDLVTDQALPLVLGRKELLVL